MDDSQTGSSKGSKQTSKIILLRKFNIWIRELVRKKRGITESDLSYINYRENTHTHSERKRVGYRASMRILIYIGILPVATPLRKMSLLPPIKHYLHVTFHRCVEAQEPLLFYIYQWGLRSLILHRYCIDNYRCWVQVCNRLTVNNLHSSSFYIFPTLLPWLLLWALEENLLIFHL